MTYRYNLQPDGFRLPAELGLSDDVEAQLRERAWRLVVSGNGTDEDYVIEMADDELGLDAATATRALAATLAARREQQAAWGPDEPRTALTEAFAALADIGVLARENFSCCGTCAPGEMYDERDDSRTWRGFVYYHQQDTEDLLESGSTYLGYGAFLDAWMTREEWEAVPDAQKDRRYADITVALMDEVVAVLEQRGIDVRWDHRPQTRILLTGVDYYTEV